MKSLRHRPTLDGLIARGVEANVRWPERPYTELSDDARVRHYSQMSPDVWRDLELKLAIARRYHHEVKLAAMRGGRTLGAQMVQQGIHPHHRQHNWDPFEGADAMEARIIASEAMSEAEREQGIQLARAGIARGRRQYDEAIRDPQSVSERLARATGDVAGYGGRIIGGGAGLVAGALAGPAAPGGAIVGAAAGAGAGAAGCGRCGVRRGPLMGPVSGVGCPQVSLGVRTGGQVQEQARR